MSVANAVFVHHAWYISIPAQMYQCRVPYYKDVNNDRRPCLAPSKFLIFHTSCLPQANEYHGLKLQRVTIRLRRATVVTEVICTYRATPVSLDLTSANGC